MMGYLVLYLVLSAVCWLVFFGNLELHKASSIRDEELLWIVFFSPFVMLLVLCVLLIRAIRGGS